MKTSNNFVIVNEYTQTAKYLTPMIFNKEALPSLSALGLVNVFLDDYGYTKRYHNCLFFLFAVDNDSDYDKLEKILANFNSFYDYYNINNNGMDLRMFVFKVHNLYLQDLFSFKQERFFDLSQEFLRISEPNIDFTEVRVNLQNEIYRFNLEIAKEEL